MPIFETFYSDADFAAFVHNCSLQAWRKSTKSFIGPITQLRDAIAKSKNPDISFRLDGVLNLREEVSNLKSFRHNLSSGLELETNLAMAGSEALQEKFGALELLNGGRPVTFSAADSQDMFLECDGLAKAPEQLSVLLNEAKMRFTAQDVRALKEDRACKLQTVLAKPEYYYSSPAGILEQLAGGLHIVPIASSSNFDAEAEQACEEAGIPRLHKDGSGFRCILPSSKPLAVLR
jgi:hypothetical protein